jgi:hypothetical protein
MRNLAFGPRQSGRTTQLAHEILRDLACHDRKVYVVAEAYWVADRVRDIIRLLNGDRTRVIPVGLESLKILCGCDPLDIYFEHTAYEKADSRQLIMIYELEDLRARIIWGAP